jgi:hypothetical protein
MGKIQKKNGGTMSDFGVSPSVFSFLNAEGLS